MSPQTQTRLKRYLLLAGVGSVLAVMLMTGLARAQQTLSIDIFGPGQAKTNYILAEPLAEGPLPQLAGELRERIRDNLAFLPFLHQVPASDVLGGSEVEGATSAEIDFKRFSLSRVDFLVTQAWKGGPDGALVALRVYEVFRGRLLFGQEYSRVKPEHISSVAEQFCSRLMEELTGRKGFFTSRIAFVRKNGASSEIWICNPTGESVRQATRLGGHNLSPSWSADGKSLAFTHVAAREHLLGLWNAESNETRTVNIKGNTVISPTYTPEGRLAVTVDITGQPNIYLLDLKYQPARALAKSWSIDVSPSFSRDGRNMAFSSGRLGNPHIFLLDMDTNKVQRVTWEGKYNTSPSLSPDGRLLAFSRDTSAGHRIFIMDLETGREKQVSFGPGFDEEPTWDPDGYFLAFTSNRTGTYKLYLTTRHGEEPISIPTGPGEARAPNWAPAR